MITHPLSPPNKRKLLVLVICNQLLSYLFSFISHYFVIISYTSGELTDLKINNPDIKKQIYGYLTGKGGGKLGVWD